MFILMAESCSKQNMAMRLNDRTCGILICGLYASACNNVPRYCVRQDLCANSV